MRDSKFGTMQEKFTIKRIRIKFHEETWVLKEHSGGFGGVCSVRATLIKPEPFEIMSLATNDKINYSTILVHKDNFMDGDTIRLLNVPNCLFEVLN